MPKADGTLSYGTPITIAFFDPSNPAAKAVTDFVGIRGDMVPSGGTASMEAFDTSGQSLGTVTDFDSSLGLTLAINATGIHSILLTQDSASGPNDGTIGYDNLEFNEVSSAPAPATLLLLSLGLPIALRRR
jgi:hypothetical protein